MIDERPKADLFGHLISPQTGKAKTVAKGYARRPGSGPAGEMCKTCEFAVRVQGGSRNFYKCLIVKHRWTNGPGSDIKLKSPACEMWQAEKPLAVGPVADATHGPDNSAALASTSAALSAVWVPSTHEEFMAQRNGAAK